MNIRNIAFDVSDLSTGRADGTTRYTTELAQRLPIKLHQYQWQLHAPIAFENPPSSDNINLHISSAPLFWTQTRLALELVRTRPNVLFMPIQQLPYLRPSNTKTVAVVHDLAFHEFAQYFTYKDWALQHLFTSYTVQNADHLIAISNSTKSDIAKYYGRTHDVSVIHHGVDHAIFTSVGEPGETDRLRKLFPASRKPFLLFVGQIQPRKNIVRLIEAFELLSDHPEMQLFIVGKEGWLKSDILEKMNSSSATERIHLLENVSHAHLPLLYRHAQVFVLPSLLEGFGLPVLEAMASGCPVVTSNTSALAEISGDAAVLCDPLSTTDISRAISQAIADKDRLRHSGLARAADFTWDKTAAATAEVIEQLLL